MRILLLTNLYPTERAPWDGGFIRSRVEALRSAGHEVECRAIVPVRVGAARWAGRLAGGDPRGHGAQQGSPFPPLFVPMDDLASLRMHRGVCSRRLVAKAARALNEAFDLGAFDLVIAHGMYGIPAGAVARAAVGPGNYSVVCHGSDVNVLMASNRQLYRAALDDSNVSLFVSAALASRARELGMSSQRVAVVPNGVDLALFNPGRRDRARERLGLSAEDDVVAFVGKLAMVKGADRLPEIAAAVVEVRPAARWLIAGDGPLGVGLAQAFGSEVRMLGRLAQDEVADMMAASDALVIPSRSEGWPTVIREAHASGTPVVGSSVGGIPEALAQTGRVVPEGPGFERRFAQAVAETLDEGPRNRGELRAAAERNSWSVVVQKELAEITRSLI